MSENDTKEYAIKHISIAPNPDIYSVMVDYRRRFLPMTQLFSDYAAHISRTAQVGNRQTQRQKKSIPPYERGMTAAEKKARKDVSMLESCCPTDVIRALFYNISNNESDFECSVLRPMLYATATSANTALVINPSPDFLLADFNDESGTIYLVPDPTVATLYRKQFNTNRIYSLDHFPDTLPCNRFLVMQRQYPDVDKLLAPLAALAPNAKGLVCMPHVSFKGDGSPFWTALDQSSLYVKKALRVDTQILSKPKKKTVLVLGPKPSKKIALWDSSYIANTEILTLHDAKKAVSYARFRAGGTTMKQLLRDGKKVQTSQVRAPASKYYFSDEIVISYTGKRDHSGNYRLIPSYRIPTKRPNEKRWVKLFDLPSHRIAEELKEDVLEILVLDPAHRSGIAADIMARYADSLHILTLKTAWFLYSDSMEKDREYNPDVARALFSKNNTLAKLKLYESTTDDVIRAVEATLGRDRDEIEYTYWRQLNLIIQKLVRYGLATVNPIEEFAYSRSNKLTSKQREVRNALAKRNLEPEEFRRIIVHLSADHNGQKLYAEDYWYVAGWLKLLTGMSNAEICALRWSDYIALDFDLGYQLRVTKRRTQAGKDESYDEKNRARIRNIPVPIELQFILNAFRSRICDITNLSAAQLRNMPIVASLSKSEDDELKPISPDEMLKINNELLNAAGIDSHIITLHDDGDEEEMDLSVYKGDFFKVNAYHYYRYVCNMPDSEARYILGKTQATTLNRNYLGFSYDLKQYHMAQEMRRGIACYSEMIGLPATKATGAGCVPLSDHLELQADGQHALTVDILFPEGCQEGSTLSIQAGHGLNWTCNFSKEEKSV